MIINFTPIKWNRLYVLAAFFLYACSIDHELSNDLEKLRVPGESCYSLNLDQYLTLLSICGDEDEVTCANLISDENLNDFLSIHDFYEFKQIDVQNFEEEIHNLGNSFVYTNLSLALPKNADIRIQISHKLNHEDEYQEYILTSVSSKLEYDYNSEGRTWSQIDYNWETMNGQIFVNLYGVIEYEFKIGNTGIRFTDYKYFKIVLDSFSGYVYWIIEVN